jgi:hypothetical protein
MMACISKRRGRWVIDFYDTYGKRRWKTLPNGSTKKKAQDSLREIEDQVRKGIFIPERRIPVFKDVAKDWIEYKQDNVRASSLKMYKGHLKFHFTAIDPIRINRITTSRVEKFISEKQQNGMNLTTLRKVSDLRQSRRLEIMNRSKRYSEKIL